MPHYDKSHPNALSEESNESEAYCIRICVYADGTFAASGPEPMGEDLAPDAEPLPSINEAMKAAFTIFKAHPVGGDDQAQFEAGLQEESGGMIDA